MTSIVHDVSQAERPLAAYQQLHVVWRLSKRTSCRIPWLYFQSAATECSDSMSLLLGLHGKCSTKSTASRGTRGIGVNICFYQFTWITFFSFSLFFFKKKRWFFSNRMQQTVTQRGPIIVQLNTLQSHRRRCGDWKIIRKRNGSTDRSVIEWILFFESLLTF